MVQRILLPLGFLLGSAACGSDGDVGTIEFRVTGGLAGTGDGTPSLQIESGGVTTRTSAGGHTETITLDPATTLDLDHKVRAARFDTLAPMYLACADCYTAVVSVELGGTAYTVTADSVAQIPMPLAAVIATLQDIAGRPLDQP